MEGWIKLHRKFTEWEWFDTEHMVKLFLYLVLSANHKDGNWRGIDVKRGQLITGLNALGEKTKISVQSLRTCLSRLEKTGEINTESTNKYRIITICNYDSYQSEQQAINNQDNKQVTNKQQSTNNQSTTNKNVKKEKNDDNVNIEFENFWNLYDKKTGPRGKIEKKWNNLKDEERVLIIQHLNKYIPATPDKQYRKNPETYLNQNGWEHEVIMPTEEKKHVQSKQNAGEPVPKNYGVRSETATQMPDSLKKRIKEIGQ